MTEQLTHTHTHTHTLATHTHTHTPGCSPWPLLTPTLHTFGVFGSFLPAPFAAMIHRHPHPPFVAAQDFLLSFSPTLPVPSAPNHTA